MNASRRICNYPKYQSRVYRSKVRASQSNDTIPFPHDVPIAPSWNIHLYTSMALQTPSDVMQAVVDTLQRHSTCGTISTSNTSSNSMIIVSSFGNTQSLLDAMIQQALHHEAVYVKDMTFLYSTFAKFASPLLTRKSDEYETFMNMVYKDMQIIHEKNISQYRNICDVWSSNLFMLCCQQQQKLQQKQQLKLQPYVKYMNTRDIVYVKTTHSSTRSTGSSTGSSISSSTGSSTSSSTSILYEKSQYMFNKWATTNLAYKHDNIVIVAKRSNMFPESELTPDIYALSNITQSSSMTLWSN